MTTTASVVAFDQVSKAYDAVRAVDGLPLDLSPGQTVALLGPNGAGKSTTLDLLLGLKKPDSGTVRLFGTSPRDAIVAGRVGAMPQSGGLMDEVTVAELVRLACDPHPKPYRPSAVLSRAGIAQIADRKVDKLSGGQAQRVRFALATAGDSDLIVLDEPTTGMDVTTRHAFWATLRQQADQGRTVLFATHYLEEADAVADRVLVLHRGRLRGVVHPVRGRRGLAVPEGHPEGVSGVGFGIGQRPVNRKQRVVKSLWTGIWLVYLGAPVSDLLHGGHSTGVRILGRLGLAAFVAWYMGRGAVSICGSAA
ncbi:ABC transporter ATP-binding protein [Streptomyces massasporeus]|uniref:ABC transporter ATP-binding protein n=1 Tax=Streptomyces massasporeus TaxID=67324 RepID=A0ABW6LCF3_9ACTN